MADRTLNTADELKSVNDQITSTNADLGKYGDINGYLGLLRNTFNASYAANQDIIQARQGMRAQLYGQEPAYKPAGWEMMTPEQQNAVRNAPKPGLNAGIQALNETEAARGQKVENVLGQAKDEATARREFLTTQLAQLTNRRSELEAADNKLKNDNRSWALDALTKYPSLAKSLNDKELANINKGVLDDAILAKISAASAAEDQKADISQTEFTDNQGNTFILGVDKNTGKVLYRTPIGKKTVTGGSGVAGVNTLAKAAKLGYTLVHNEIGGVTFKLKGKPITSQEFEDGTGLSYLQALADFGTTDPGDIEKLKAAGIMAESKATTDPKEELRTQIQAASASGASEDDIISYIKAQGYNPSDFGY
jgi:hypothetical protein